MFANLSKVGVTNGTHTLGVDGHLAGSSAFSITGAQVYNGGSTNSCTVRFVYRIFDYSFVLGIFDSLRFRIFVLVLVKIL